MDFSVEERQAAWTKRVTVKLRAGSKFIPRDAAKLPWLVHSFSAVVYRSPISALCFGDELDRPLIPKRGGCTPAFPACDA